MDNTFDVSEDFVQILAALPDSERTLYFDELLGETPDDSPNTPAKVLPLTDDDTLTTPLITRTKRPQPKVDCGGAC